MKQTQQTPFGLTGEEQFLATKDLVRELGCFQFFPASENDIEKAAELMLDGFSLDGAVDLVDDINLSYEE